MAYNCDIADEVEVQCQDCGELVRHAEVKHVYANGTHVCADCMAVRYEEYSGSCTPGLYFKRKDGEAQ